MRERLTEPVERVAQALNRFPQGFLVIEQLSFAMHAVPEALRQVVHQHEVDQQQRVGFLFEIQVKLRPLRPVDRRRLDREVDVRALEVVAAGARAEQPDPLDRGMLGKPTSQLQDQLATRKLGRQRRGCAPVMIRGSNRSIARTAAAIDRMRLTRAAAGRPAAPRARRGPSSRHWPRPRRWSAGSPAEPRPAPRRCGPPRRAG